MRKKKKKKVQKYRGSCGAKAGDAGVEDVLNEGEA